MKLIRFGQLGQEKPGLLLENGKRIDASAFGEDYTEDFFATDGLDRLAAWLKANEASAPEVDGAVRLASPIARPSKIICIGLNYSDHAAESGMEVPPEPVVFFKATSSLVGPNDDLVIPRNSQQTDYEVELAFVIRKRASYVEEADALDYIAGYALHNDYSEREYQHEHCGQWVKGKSCDTFAPLGPFLATPDEIDDVHNLRLWLKVNGETRQDGTTAKMVYNVPFLVSYLSRFMSLLPGDIISTGTPPGVGGGFKPPKYLKAGDVIELGIDGLGESTQEAKAYEA
jgi:2-keto-4-pentenoate hydratase/2-oxohepta-3-ene-1,7-dioic acid hydratase in catechol pathway